MGKFFTISVLSAMLAVAPCVHAAPAAQADTIGPLLGGIMYDQGTPYNDLCPSLNGEGKSVTGCVATAMAQVMRYYKFPAVGHGSSSYTSSQGAVTYNFDNHPFDWDNMLETYTRSNYSLQQGQAVATLMLACGASVNMTYSADGSGAQTDKAQAALKNYFYYSNAKLAETTDQNVLVNDWVYTIQENLDNGRPVIYAGSSGSFAGHCFVVDGYTIDAEGTYWFHCNWGWSGLDNDWYKITNFAPPSDGTGNNYSGYRNSMVYNIYPDGGTAVEEVTHSMEIDANMPIYNIFGVQVRADQLQHGNIYIQNGQKIIF